MTGSRLSRRWHSQYLLRQKQSRATGQATAAYLWAGRELCRRVILDGLRGAQAVYTFNSAGLELLQFAHLGGYSLYWSSKLVPPPQLRMSYCKRRLQTIQTGNRLG